MKTGAQFCGFAPLAFVLLLSVGCVLRPEKDDISSFITGYLVAQAATGASSDTIMFQGYIANASTGGLIPRFTFVGQTGQSMSYVDSATDGLSVTMLRSGIIDVYYANAANGANDNSGISRNADISTSTLSLPASQVIGVNLFPNGNMGSVSAVAQSVSVGDVIRPHNGAAYTPAGALQPYCGFRILLRNP